MNTATIAQAPTKGLRTNVADIFGKIRTAVLSFYTTHSAHLVTDAAQPASGALARNSLARLLVLGSACEQYAPALANDMTHDAAR